MMHEMALMGDILQLIRDDCQAKEIDKLEIVELIVGEISNSMPEALEMAFSIYKERYPEFIDPAARLLISIEKAEAECVLCGLQYEPSRRLAVCPACHLPSGRIISGETFKVLSYEGR